MEASEIPFFNTQLISGERTAFSLWQMLGDVQGNWRKFCVFCNMLQIHPLITQLEIDRFDDGEIRDGYRHLPLLPDSFYGYVREVVGNGNKWHELEELFRSEGEGVGDNCIFHVSVSGEEDGDNVEIQLDIPRGTASIVMLTARV